jgi:hypothetical protein
MVGPLRVGSAPGELAWDWTGRAATLILLGWKGMIFGPIALPPYCEISLIFGWLTSLRSFGLPQFTLPSPRLQGPFETPCRAHGPARQRAELRRRGQGWTAKPPLQEIFSPATRVICKKPMASSSLARPRCAGINGTQAAGSECGARRFVRRVLRHSGSSVPAFSLARSRWNRDTMM